MNLITNFLTMQNQLRIFHWQTRSYAAHKALGDAYEGLDGLIDEFIEVFQGKNGIIKAKDNFTVVLENLDGSPSEAIDGFIAYLTSDITQGLNPDADTDLLNIRDEMTGLLNKTKYLLTLK